MLNNVHLSYIIVLLVSGAVLMAAIYHTILFVHRPTKLLAAYSAYLWATCCYCCFRTIYIQDDTLLYQHFNPDEVLQMIAFGFYIRFASVALDLNRQHEKFSWWFARITPAVVAVYIVVNTALVNSPGHDIAYMVAKVCIRFYLLFLGFLMLVPVIRNRQSIYYRYLAAGAISMIVCGLISSFINLYFDRGSMVIGALAWLMFGFFLDVIFFSSAIGYRTRQEHKQREKSLQELINKEAELQQMAIEKVRTVYETREEERLRIARDLHDDMGSTLSSIGIYSKVVQEYLNSDKLKAGKYLKKIQETTKELMEHTHDLIWSLQTNYGKSESVFHRIRKTAFEMLSGAGISPQVQIQEDNLQPVDLEAQKNIWLICREALTNVCKYSNATNCVVKIDSTQSELNILIQDDGIGFDLPKPGNGLINMKLRAESLNGTFYYSSSSGKGTTIHVVVPKEKILIADVDDMHGNHVLQAPPPSHLTKTSDSVS